MGEKWLVFSAWPYVNTTPHLGNLIGSVLSADIAARYLRLKGHEVVFASGSDEHGTPIEIEAIKSGLSPRELTDKMHRKVSDLFRKWDISFDNYTRTESDVHKKFVIEFYKKVYENGYVFEDIVQMPYCPKDRMFLPDRFIEGTCPFCGYERARGDQCDNCGRLLEPTLLINPRCAICGSSPVIKTTKHWFIDLPALQDKVRDYVESNENLPQNARNMSLQMIREGLKPRALTRDNKWGIPAPFPGAEDKTIYVWMEAVLGYISAVKEYFEKRGEPDKWREFWFGKDTKSVFFIGKDNIPFHVIIFPALLIASKEGYTLPWTVASTEYLLFEGEKFSKSRRIGVWIDEALELLPVDYWRFALVATRPEVRDTNFSWKTLQEVVNGQLNDAIGNYVHRVVTMVSRYFNGLVPEGTEMGEGRLVIEKVWRLVDEVDDHMRSFRFKQALSKIVEIASVGNRFLNESQPWAAEEDERASILYTALSIVKTLAILLYPIIPGSATRMWRIIGYEDTPLEAGWEEAKRPFDKSRRVAAPSKPLFTKISDEELSNIRKKLDEIRSRRQHGP